MGGGRFDPTEHINYTRSKSYDRKTVQEIYSRRLDDALNPRNISLRESRDSDDNPESNAIIIGLDVTGSMSRVLDVMARQGLPELMTAIYDRQPISDPHVMCMAIGDIDAADEAPLQITQFEADIRIAEQLEKIYLEQGGGGNRYESYTLPWLWAAEKTQIDCFEKRQKKGYIFTIGDEAVPPVLKANRLNAKIGGEYSKDYTAAELLQMVRQKYEVFHLIVEEGDRGKDDFTVTSWRNLLGQSAIFLDDHRNLAQTIVSAIQINEGMDPDEVANSWTGSVVTTVRRAFNLRS
jgi:hypothetical protein